MDIVGEEQGRLARLAGWLQASRAELAGLAVLLVGTVVAAGALWWSALGPATPPARSGIAADGDPAGLDGATGHAAHGRAHGGAPDHRAADGAPAGGHGAADGPAADGHAAEHEAADAPLTVHVTGAVGAPGIVTVDAGARVADAIAAAGEATDDGEPHRLNLARVVADGEQIHVPREGEEVPPPPADGAAQGVGGPVDLNRADAATLETLPGIGPAKAEAIIDHREAHGSFAEPGDLRDVPGIGDATFQRLADDVTVS